MALLVFALGGALLAAALRGVLQRGSRFRPYADEGAGALDAVSAWAVLTFVVWTGTSWFLALSHGLAFGPLLVCGLAEGAAGGAVLYRIGALRTRMRYPSAGSAAAVAIVLFPIFIWIVFALWRGGLLPVYNHDALAYHLPKAVFLLKGRGFHVLDVPEARIATWPCNYELLLADTMVLSGGDHFTAAVGTLAYVVMLVLTARLAASWWGGGFHAAVAAVVVGTVPIAVLHTGLHKNDLLSAVFVLGAISWGARWLAAGCVSAAVLSVAALLLAIGTKVSGFFLAVAVLPLLAAGAYRFRRSLDARTSLFCAAALVPAAVLLGSWPYVANLVSFHELTRPLQITGGVSYGAWSNVWMYTLLVLWRPFESDPGRVWNPFRGEYWWWPANDVWMSHFGVVLSVLTLLLPVSVLLFRKKGARTERAAASAAAVVVYVLSLPIRMGPYGFFASYGRYVVWIAAVVVAWVLSPLLVELTRRAGPWRGAVIAVIVVALLPWEEDAFMTFGVGDAYAPLEYVKFMMDHPSSRVPFVRQNRAASVFDAIAGPGAHCAIDVGYDTWIYPAYGEHWTRQVDFLAPSPAPINIADDVSWVIVDRTWNIIFGHPSFVDMGKAGYLGMGRPSEDDVRVYRQLTNDPRFALVYEDRAQLQALFRRKPVSKEKK